MLFAFYIYLFIGLILSLIGPLSWEIKNEISNTNDFSDINYKLRLTLFVIIIVLGTILFYPIYFYYYFFQNGKEKSELRIKQSDKTKLFFYKMAGSGDLKCIECQHTVSITSFTHGIDPETKKRCDNTGHQCKDCGKFVSVFGYECETLEIKDCDCGGKLESNSPLFCPQCKSYKVIYHMRYIT